MSWTRWFEKKTPFFSVVVAAANRSRFIVPTIDSALQQTYRRFELIVVGDGCSDDTAEVLRRRYGRRIRWRNLPEPSGSQSRPNNEGLRLARGSHVAYLGHDDIWTPDHLERLAEVIRQTDPDVVVSGAIYYGPPGSKYYQITGLFSDAKIARTHFFPPSSVAHRRDVIGKVGEWRAPENLRAPVDCDFLLRAVAAGCSFKSTQTITVHKFAAGHRYLSYRFPSCLEQEKILRRVSSPAGNNKAITAVLNDLAQGALAPPVVYPDFEKIEPGEMHRRSREAKGLKKTETSQRIDSPTFFTVDLGAAGLDWHEPETDSSGAIIRWSGPNPNPLYFLNVNSAGPVRVRIHIAAFANPALAERLELEINDRAAVLQSAERAEGDWIATAQVNHAIAHGLKLRFQMPYNVWVNQPHPRRVGFALRGFEIIPDSHQRYGISSAAASESHGKSSASGSL